MFSKHAARGTARTAIIALASALALTTTTGCFGSPRATDTFAGAAIGAGGGALIGGAEGSPGTGALIGGLGGGVVGYLVGSETEHYNDRYYDGPRCYHCY
jgi:Glycine zipper